MSGEVLKSLEMRENIKEYFFLIRNNLINIYFIVKKYDILNFF